MLNTSFKPLKDYNDAGAEICLQIENTWPPGDKHIFNPQCKGESKVY